MIRITVWVLVLGLLSGCQMYRKSNDPIHRVPPPGATTGQLTPFSMMTTTFQRDRYRLFLAGGVESVRDGVEQASLFTLTSLQASVPEVPNPEGELVVFENVTYEPLSDSDVTGTWTFDQPACRIRLRTAEGRVAVLRAGSACADDGILGAGTRDAVREEQRRLGMPADAWPTAKLLNAL